MQNNDVKEIFKYEHDGVIFTAYNNGKGKLEIYDIHHVYPSSDERGALVFSYDDYSMDMSDAEYDAMFSQFEIKFRQWRNLRIQRKQNSESEDEDDDEQSDDGFDFDDDGIDDIDDDDEDDVSDDEENAEKRLLDLVFSDPDFPDPELAFDELSSFFWAAICDLRRRGEGGQFKTLLTVPLQLYKDDMIRDEVKEAVKQLESYTRREWAEIEPKMMDDKWLLSNVDRCKDLYGVLGKIPLILRKLESYNSKNNRNNKAENVDIVSDKNILDLIMPTQKKKGDGQFCLDDISLDGGEEKGSSKKAPLKTFDLRQLIEEKFKGLIGLNNIKTQLYETIAFILQNRDRNPDISLHMVFVGNPGTGKTTVASIVAEVLFEAGILSSDKPNVIVGSNMQALYLGQTSEKVRELFRKGIGKVTLIDEAYSLVGNGYMTAYQSDAISVMVEQLERHRNDSCFILAGYPKEMSDLLKTNPGLASRVPSVIKFDDFSNQDLCRIFDVMIQQSGSQIDNDALQFVYRQLASLSLAKNFGNARGVRNVLGAILRKQAARVNGDSKNRLIILEDAKNGIEEYEKQNGATDSGRRIGF